RLQRRVEIAFGALLNLGVAALLDERRQPPDLELAPDEDQEVRPLKFQDEARLRFDEMRILIAARERLDRDLVAADLTRDRREILDRGDHIQPRLRRRRIRRDDPKDDCEQYV